MVVSYGSSPPAEVIYASEPLDDAPTASLVGKNMCFRQIEFAGILQGAVLSFAVGVFALRQLRLEVRRPGLRRGFLLERLGDRPVSGHADFDLVGDSAGSVPYSDGRHLRRFRREA